MKINAIGVTTFGNKQQVVKKAMPFVGAALGAVAADTFVKGISAPVEEVEDVIRANDDMGGWNPCDPICDAICYGE